MAEGRWIKEFFANVASWAFNSSGVEVKQLAEDDGTPRVQLVGWDGAQERVGVETTAELKVSNYGKSSGTATAFKVESTGEQDIVLHGVDEGSNIDAFRTDPNRIQWQRPYEERVYPPAVAITNAELVVLDGSAVLSGSASNQYDVWYKVNNVDGTNTAHYTLGKDNDAGGSLASPEFWAFQEDVVGQSSTGWLYGGWMNGDDDLRASAEADSDLVIQFKVVRLDVGA